MQRGCSEGAAREALTSDQYVADLVAKVERALNRVAAVKHQADTMLRCTASSMMTIRMTSDLYDGLSDPKRLILAVVKFAEFAPLGVLESMAAIADREFSFAEWWDERGYAESIGAVREFGYLAWASKRAEVQ